MRSNELIGKYRGVKKIFVWWGWLSQQESTGVFKKIFVWWGQMSWQEITGVLKRYLHDEVEWGHTRKTGNNSPAFQQSQLNVLFSEIPLRSFCVLQFNISFTTERISNASFLLTKLLSSQQTRQKPSLNHHISPFRPWRKSPLQKILILNSTPTSNPPCNFHIFHFIFQHIKISNDKAKGKDIGSDLMI